MGKKRGRPRDREGKKKKKKERKGKEMLVDGAMNNKKMLFGKQRRQNLQSVPEKFTLLCPRTD